MAFPAETIVADACIRTTWATRRNRFYFNSDTAPTGLTDLEAIADAIMGAYAPVFTPLMHNRATLMRVECRYYGSTGSDLEANSTVPGVDGTIIMPDIGSEEDDGTLPDALPDEVSLLVQVRTGQVGRQRRGRRFITGLSERVQIAGRVNQEFVPKCKDLANKFSDDIPLMTGSFSTTLHARHYNRKDNVLIPITKCYAVATMGSRIDRRNPLELERL